MPPVVNSPAERIDYPRNGPHYGGNRYARGKGRALERVSEGPVSEGPVSMEPASMGPVSMEPVSIVGLVTKCK